MSRYIIYAATIEGETHPCYVGFSSNFPQRITAHKNTPCFKGVYSRLRFSVLRRTDDINKARRLETQIATQLKRVGGCRFNILPSYCLLYVNNGRALWPKRSRNYITPVTAKTLSRLGDFIQSVIRRSTPEQYEQLKSLVLTAVGE